MSIPQEHEAKKPSTAVRARRKRAWTGKKPPSRAAVESALALYMPLNENLYQHLVTKIDVARLLRARKGRT